MLFYFGFAFLIDDTIREGADHLTAREEELSFTEGLVAAVSYFGLSGWLWMRWRNPKAPSTKILGPAIFATVTAEAAGGHYDLDQCAPALNLIW